jgi:uncharacterized protein (UPF0335 family)
MDDQAFSAEAVAADQLRSFVERIERIEEEIKERNADKSDIYKEAKMNGFDVKVMRKLIAIRREDYAERQEEDAILEIYMQSLGMI